jgi:hypothetical protein
VGSDLVPFGTSCEKKAPREAKQTDWYESAMIDPMDHIAEVEISIRAFACKKERPP